MRNKKLELAILTVTIAFAAFTIGFFTGRSSVKGSFTVETQHTEKADTSTETENTQTDTTDIVRDETNSSAGLININTADVIELSELPGIGEVLAQRIIEYRNENGDFRTIDDIRNVNGIGDSIFDSISSMITVG